MSSAKGTIYLLAPGGPEVEDYDLAALVFQMNFPALEIGQVQFGGAFFLSRDKQKGKYGETNDQRYATYNALSHMHRRRRKNDFLLQPVVHAVSIRPDPE